MKTRAIGWLWTVGLAVACSPPSEAPPPATVPPPAAVPTAPTAAPVATASAPVQAPIPSPEEQRKAKDREQLLVDWASFEREDAAEVARLTPEIHADTKLLVEHSYPSLRAALTAVLAGKHRKPGNPPRDAFRHPLETLELFGLKPTQTVLEYGPGDGWYTEILAPVLAKKGKLIVTSTDPNGPKEERATLYGQRTKRFLERLPEAYGKVATVIVDPKAPNLGSDGSVDLVLFSRGAHGLNNDKTLTQYLAEFHRVLKPNGVLGVEQHRAPAGADPVESSKHGYLPEAWLTSEIVKAGFKLAAKSEINANPKDTKDYPEGVWTLPPTLRLGDKDRDRYLAIGESDRMTLKFVKVADKQPHSVPRSPTP